MPDRLRPGVRLLVDAYEYAADLAAPSADFAIEPQILFDRGMTRVDLLWLVRKGFLAEIGPSVAVFLTPVGIESVLGLLDRPGATPTAVPEVLPEWDTARRELRWVGQVVKRFRVPAPNQEIILATFQEEAWAPHIDDPLPPAHGVQPKRRLHDTIVALNRHQHPPGLRFVGDGTGLGVRWEGAGQ